MEILVVTQKTGLMAPTMKLEINMYLVILDTSRDWLVKIYLHLAMEIQLRKPSGKNILSDMMLSQKNVSCH